MKTSPYDDRHNNTGDNNSHKSFIKESPHSNCYIPLAELEPNIISLLQRIPRLRLVMNTWGFASLPASPTVQVLEDDAAGVTSQILIYDRQSLTEERQQIWIWRTAASYEKAINLS